MSDYRLQGVGESLPLKAGGGVTPIMSIYTLCAQLERSLSDWHCKGNGPFSHSTIGRLVKMIKGANQKFRLTKSGDVEEVQIRRKTKLVGRCVCMDTGG